MLTVNTAPKTIDERLVEHAEMLGEDVSRVRAVNLNGFHMRANGTFVDVDLHGFSMFTVRASKLDLGIPRDDMRSKYITSGTKRLIPEEYVKRLTNIGNRFRASLERNSFNVTGPWRWVPYTAYERWKEEWTEIEADLEALKDEVLGDYDNIKTRLTEIYTRIGLEAWDAIVARQGGTPNDALDLGGGLVFENRDAYVNHVVQNVLKRLPTPDQIRHGIYATYYNARMMSLAEVEDDRLVQAQREAERAEETARTARAREEAEAQRRLVWDEEEKQRRLIRAEAEERELEVKERRIKMQAMHDAEMEHARAQITRDGSMYQSIFDQYRAMIHDAATSILAAIEKHGYLPGPTAEQARSLNEVFAALNGHHDQEIESVLQRLEEIMARRVPHPKRTNAETYDTQAIARQLEKIAEITIESAQRIAREAGSTRAGALFDF